MKLYKFCSGNFLIENLRESKIYLGKIGNCNDPHEGSFNIDVETRLLDQFVLKFYPFGINLPHYLKGLTIQKVQFDYMKKFKSEVGVTCFSEIRDSQVMWGHYTDKQVGVCLEFEKNTFDDYGIKPVDYVKEVPRIKFLDRESITEDYFKQKHENVGYTKSSEWSYEKEWRILGRAGDFIYYEKVKLRGIYFGFNATKDYVEKIFEATKNYPNVKYYKPGLTLDKYGVQFIETSKFDLK